MRRSNPAQTRRRRRRAERERERQMMRDDTSPTYL
jgi:hypothetical protein